MKRVPLLLSISLFFLITKSPAQSTNPEFGNYTVAERTLKECAFDKEAEAVVLLDEAYADYDDEYHLITTRRIRLKILNQRGVDKGNIIIPFYSGEQFEFITNIEGMTYDTETGTVSSLNKKSIYTEKEDSRYSNMRFALPNVKVGSIVEYKYTSIMKHYGGLRDWRFQNEIPTIKSSFKLQILPGAEFAYLISKKENYPVVITPMPDIGRIYFEMNNIPGLRFEPYMDAPKDYLQRVEFQLSGFTNGLGSKQKVNQSWKAMSYDLATDKDLGGAVKKNLSIPDDLKFQVDKQSTATDKARTIYNYVKTNFTWNGYHSKFATDALKKIWDKRSGTSGEINLIFLNLLESFSIESYPLLVAERNYGKVYPEIPLLDRFNKTVAYIQADGQTFIADATQKNCPFGLTPYSLLNTFGLVVSKKTDEVINIGNKSDIYDAKVDLKMKLEQSGSLSGVATINSSFYAKESRLTKIKEDSKKYVAHDIEEPQHGLKVEDFSCDNMENDSALVEHITFNNQLNEDGGFVLMNYNLFTGLPKNPFTANERFTNVNFGYPYHVVVQESIELPANALTDNLPKNITIQTPDKEITISRQILRAGNILMIKIDFQQTMTLVSYEDYDGLKMFYQRMIETLNDPIVIKMVK
ncbi:MAG: DUF3857 domain-containing protein [Chitinophagaceae bacterium]